MKFEELRQKDVAYSRKETERIPWKETCKACSRIDESSCYACGKKFASNCSSIANQEKRPPTSGPNEIPKSSKLLCTLKEMKNASANKLENSQFVKEINDGMLTKGKGSKSWFD